jgi:hypothetical protein
MTPKPNEARPQGLTRTGRAQAGQGLYEPTPAEQRTARIMGAWFLATFVFSIPAFWFYDPVLTPQQLRCRRRPRHPHSRWGRA